MELNKPGYFEVEFVQVIKNFDPDPYGNIWYNAKLQGEAEAVMWLAKNEPKPGKVYGHLEETKSGKRLRFRTDKEPESTSGGGYKKSPEQEEAIARAVALKAAVDFYGSDNDKSPQVAIKIADEFLAWLKGNEEKPNTEASVTLEDIINEEPMDIPEEFKHG